jgi:nitrite transporter NirC
MIWWGLFAFISIGLEHSIANMTLLALGIFSPYASASEVVNWGGYVSNLIPVILGNMFGGIVLFALPYCFCSKEAE